VLSIMKMRIRTIQFGGLVEERYQMLGRIETS
jgi:hypothetical protein